MSIALMTAVWTLQLPDSEKLVLLALADSANDSGKCWPSMRSLVDKCSKSERTIQTVIKALVGKGLLARLEKPGKGVIYRVYPAGDAPGQATPAKVAPPQGSHPRKICTPAAVAGTPAAVAPKPSKNPQSSSSPSASKKARVKVKRFELPSDIPADAWAGFEEMRRRIAKPMTDKARELAVEKLRAIQAEHGQPPGDVLNHATLNAYQGLFPIKDYQNGRLDRHDRGRPQRRDPAFDMLADAEARIAAERASPSGGGAPGDPLPIQ